LNSEGREKLRRAEWLISAILLEINQLGSERVKRIVKRQGKDLARVT
jgi:hypothetical protein